MIYRANRLPQCGIGKRFNSLLRKHNAVRIGHGNNIKTAFFKYFGIGSPVAFTAAVIIKIKFHLLHDQKRRQIFAPVNARADQNLFFGRRISEHRNIQRAPCRRLSERIVRKMLPVPFRKQGKIADHFLIRIFFFGTVHNGVSAVLQKDFGTFLSAAPRGQKKRAGVSVRLTGCKRKRC